MTLVSFAGGTVGAFFANQELEGSGSASLGGSVAAHNKP